MHQAKAIMIQGTGSHVGKSVLVTALGRIFFQDGYRVAPFKSQNMALNSAVTPDGGEIGRAQAVQAEACHLEPTVDMNPILLKPTGDRKSQVIVRGKALSNMSAQEYHLNYVHKAQEVILDSLRRLQEEFEILVIEGAGSPAEVNLRDYDVVNMRIARWANAPVLLAVDIDKGGALAWVVGTLELLLPEERAMVKGIIINKFRGDLALLQPALDFLEKRTGLPVVGVIPYFKEFIIPEEDSVRDDKEYMTSYPDSLDIAVMRLPHVSNFTDFEPLEEEGGVHVRYVGRGRELGNPDAIIIPGTKNTIEDLAYLHETGYAREIIGKARAGTPVIGICGGFQMLGLEVQDPHQTESHLGSMEGLGLLKVKTVFEPHKLTTRALAEVTGLAKLLPSLEGSQVRGYEIHMGQTTLASNVSAAFNIVRRSGKRVEQLDGAVAEKGFIFGTYLHGLFDNDNLRKAFLSFLRDRKGLGSHVEVKNREAGRERAYNLLAKTVRENLRMDLIYQIMGLPGPKLGGGLREPGYDL